MRTKQLRDNKGTYSPLVYESSVIDSEGNPITFNKRIESVKTIADNAQRTADNAQRAADNAQRTADNAQRAADNAQRAVDNISIRVTTLETELSGINALADNILN